MSKKDILLAGISGIMMAVIFPVLNIKELGWICLVPLLAAAWKQDPSKGFLLAGIAGSVFHIGLIYWITVSMSKYGGLPLYVSIPVLILFSIVLGFFTGVPLYISCYVQKKLGWGFTLTLPFVWTAVEYIKSWFLTGFPWDNLGYSQFTVLPLIQAADITGVYGISFLLMFVNCTIFSCVQGFLMKKNIPVREAVASCVLLGATLWYGYHTLGALQTIKETNPVRVSLVQPNIPQDLKWDPAYLSETLEKFRKLTLQSIADKPAIVIWPESATPFFYQEEDTYKEIVGRIVAETGTYLLFGSPSYEMSTRGPLYFNSALLLSPENKIAGKYDKIHLVPYGEYVPLQQLFPFIQKMVEGIGDFSPGFDVTNLKLPSCSFATLICYEIIFPDLVRRFVDKGAQFIVNITNDAWFGRTSAPYQHLSMAVLRAVENKRYIVRCANTGISACIAPSGAVTKQTNLFTETVLSAMIYCKGEKTFYTRYGDVFALSCLALTLVFILAARFTRKSLE